MKYACFFDGCTEGTSCVFDTGSIGSCDFAFELESQGYSKTACECWKPVGIPASIDPSFGVKSLIRKEAKELRDSINNSQFELDMKMIGYAPEFIGQFGHGYFRRKDVE